MEGYEERTGDRLKIQVSITHSAERDMKNIPGDQRFRIVKAIDSLEHEYFPKDFDIKKLKTFKYSFRMRVGNWRIIYSIDFEKHEILVGAILQRKHAYR